MRELVGEQPAAVDPGRLERARLEVDVIADRERARAERSRRIVGAGILVDPYAREVAPEARLHLASQFVGDGPARGLLELGDGQPEPTAVLIAP